MAQVGFLCFIEVVQQSAQGHGRRRISGGQALERLLAELLSDVFLRFVQEEPPLAAILHPAGKLVPQNVHQGFFSVSAVVQDGLRRGKASQLVDDVLRPVLAGKGRQVGLAGGDIAEGHAGAAGVHVDAAEEVAGLVVQARGVDDGAGGDHPDDVPLDEALGGGGVLHLLADGNLVALADEPGDIGLAGVVGDAAHGHPLLLGL